MATSINTAEIPVSIVASATAASYTVPSDRYAIVKAQVKTGGTLSIGGVVVLGSDTWSVITSSNGMWRSQGSAVWQTGGTAGTYSVSRGVTVTSASVSPSAGTYIGDTYGPNTNVSLVSVFGNDTARTSNTAQFKVPAGTVIVGAGDARYMIELYRIPGSAT